MINVASVKLQSCVPQIGNVHKTLDASVEFVEVTLMIEGFKNLTKISINIVPLKYVDDLIFLHPV